MGSMKWTEDQQRVIDARDSNILVSAAAGSGKTAVLVERIIQEVTDAEHPIDIDRLLVVTFTNAAAGEMRQRVGKALEEALVEHPGDKRLQKQLSLLHNAQITTIDSFCQSIIRNYFHVIDLDPVFRVADDTEIKLMKQEVLDEVLEECYQRAEAEPETEENRNFIAMIDAFSTGRDDSAAGNLVLDVHNMSQSAPWPEDWLNGIVDIYEKKTTDWITELQGYVAGMLEGYLAQARRTLEICRQDGPEEYEPAIWSDIEQLEQCAAVSDYEDYAKYICGFQKKKLASSKAENKKIIQDMRKTYIDKGIRKLEEKYFREELQGPYEQMAPAVKGLVQTTKLFEEAFSVRKREDGVLDFNDMEHFALQILVDHEQGDVPSAVAKELQEYYQEIMIDEYQDSSYIQEALLSSLSRAEQGQRPYLFMVGDVKQSIYRFRQARPELFNGKYEAYGSDPEMGQRIDLHQNFRSREMVLESTNFLFEKIMQKCLGGIVYDEAESLVPGAVFPEDSHRTAGKTQVLVIQGDKGFMDKDSLEASVIGEKIRELVQGEEPLFINDKGDYRPVHYRDIVVLLRSPSRITDKYIEVLSQMGIPAYTETKTGYFSSMEVEVILNFLRVLDNPRQDIPLASVLHSPLGGFTDNELAELGAQQQGINYYDSLRNAGENISENTRKKVSGFLDIIEKYRQRAGVLPVYDLLQQIYRETGYYHIMSAMPAGEKRAANLELLLQRALDYAGKGNHGIFSFVQYIENMKKSQVDFGEASLVNEGMDAVRIMSIHKSKGLEFPVVFLAGTATQFNLMDARGIVKDNDYGIGIDYINLEERYKKKTLLKNFLADRSVAATLAEEIRVLYVALTRAKEQLIITGVSKDLEKDLGKWSDQSPEYCMADLISARSYLSLIMPLVLDASAAPYFEVEKWDSSMVTGRVAESLVEDEEIYQKLQNWEQNICYDPEIQEEMKSEDDYHYPYEAQLQIPVKISVTELKRMELQAQKLEKDVWAEATDVPEVFGQTEERQSISVEYMEDETKDEGEKTEEAARETEIPKPRFLQGEEKLSGAQRGTVYHSIFEHLPYERMDENTTPVAFATWLDEFTAKGYLTSSEKDIVYAKDFCTFLRTDLGKRMRKAAENGTLYREQQFMMGIPAQRLHPEISGEDTDTVLVQGIIDAWFMEDEDIILVDYKTDRVKRDIHELVDKYRIQLDYYADALQRVTGRKVKKKIIYSISKGESIEIE